MTHARSWCPQCDRRQPFRLLDKALVCSECSTPLQDFPKPANPDKAPGPVEGAIHDPEDCALCTTFHLDDDELDANE